MSGVPKKRTMLSRRLRWAVAGLGALALAAVAFLTMAVGPPRNWYGFLRFAAPRMHGGALRVGDPAPDLDLVALDGKTTFHLRDRLGGRPLVLIFGSYT